MRTEQAQQAKVLIDAIKRARCEISNLHTNSDLTEWQKNTREFELCQAIDLLKSDMVDLMDRMLQNDETKTQLKAA